jgi:2-polyprenyl-3-methyl-5-hydroxy-6-metoxy-1,4-benzoquinol methylase
MTDTIEHYKLLHKDDKFYKGYALTLHKQNIKTYISITDCKNILDYGCGKGMQYFKENIHNDYFYGIMPSLYDPAVEEYSKIPDGKFDAVISTDVLEHIPEEELDDVLKQIFDKSIKFVYLGICNSLASSYLPDGRNSHVTRKPLDWWIEKCLPFSNKLTMIYVYGDSRGTALLQNNKIKLRKNY